MSFKDRIFNTRGRTNPVVITIFVLILAAGSVYPLIKIYHEKKTREFSDIPAIKKRKAFLDKKIDKDAVTVNLKSGGRLTGIIQETSDDKLILNTGYGIVGIVKDDIAQIVKATEKEKEELKERSYKTYVTEEERKKQIAEIVRREEEYLRIKKQRQEAAEREKEYRIRSVDKRMIVVEAVLDRRLKTKLLVDTGAAYVGISPELAKKLGYKIRKDSEKVNLILADGSIQQGVPIKLKSVKIGRAKADNVEAVVSEQGEKGYGILGMSFLKRFNVKVDPAKNELILKNK